MRSDAQMQPLLDALARAGAGVRLAGIEVYEGVLKEEEPIRTLLRRAVDWLQRLAGEGRLQRSPAVLTGAGSAWYDVVAQEFGKADIGGPLDLVLRPGCYLTHDAGIYQAAQRRIDQTNPVAQQMRASLQPALQVWAYVQSLPEPGRAIVALGKRDTAFEAVPPRPALRYRPGDAAPVAAPPHWEVTAMMDQHAFLKVAEDDGLRIGDMLAFDISHPCLTFDKWRQLAVVNDRYDVVDVIATYF